MTPKLFSELGLSEELLKAIDKLGFEQASPIQAASIPALLSGRDIVGQSQTGSGKTAAFAIPAIEKADPQGRHVQVLILCPTRELAVQVSEEIHKLSLFKRGMFVLPIYGGQSYERQFYGLKQGPQIVIGTPGRVMDHMRRGTLVLDRVKIAVLDEADVMLNMGFREDIETILQAVPKERQTVFFSATMPRPIRELIEKYSRTPENIRIEQKAMTVPTVEQGYYEVDRRFKLELLTRLIDIYDLKLGIIFCNTKRMVDELADHLEAQGYLADRLHGDMTQNMRDRVMNKFRKSGLEFLVATDVAARGIDVDDVQVVFNYDLPYDGEDYVHRIGRTGRAGRSGRAISFVSGREVYQIRQIERYTNMRIQRMRIPTEAEVEEARENVFLGRIRATLQRGDFKRQESLVERLLEEGFASTDIAAACLSHLQGEPVAVARPDRPEGAGGPAGGDFGRGRSVETPRRGPVEGGPARSGGLESRRPSPSRPQPVAVIPPKVAEAASEVGESEEAPKIAPANPPRGESRPAAPPAGAEAPVRPHVVARPASPRTEGEGRANTPKTGVVKPRPAPGTVRPALPNAGRASGSPASGLVQPKGKAPAGVGSVPVNKERGDEAQRVEAPSLPGAEPESGKATGASNPKEPGARSVAENYVRLHMNVGVEKGVRPVDVVNLIAGETGLPGKVVGLIDVREKYLFVDVLAPHVNAVISKLNRTQIQGQRVKVKVA